MVTNPQADKLTISLADGSTVDVPRSICSVIYGDLTAGCSCTVYYHGGKASASNIWHVDVNGSMTTYTVTYYEYYCPNCHHSVSPNADVCPYCGYRFTSASAPSYRYYCPSCYGEIPGDVDICPYCGYIFASGTYMHDGTAWLYYGEITEDDDDLGSGYRTYGVPITDGSEEEDYGSGYRTYGVPITDGSEEEDYGSGYHTYGVPITDGSDDDDYLSDYWSYDYDDFDYDYMPYDYDDFD